MLLALALPVLSLQTRMPSIKVVPAVKGAGDVDKITVTVESQLALPKPQQPSDFFFLTDDAEPTRQHPRQHALDLRDVSAQARGGVGDEVIES